MNFNEMYKSVEAARETQRQFEFQTNKVASLLVGNLRSVSRKYDGNEILKQLKKELSQFNAATGEWKS